MKNYFKLLTLFFILNWFNHSIKSQVLIKDINSGLENGCYKYPSGNDRLIEMSSSVYKNKYYFRGGLSSTNSELWVSDGTEAGTHLFKTLVEGAEGGDPGYFQVVNNILYFQDSKGRMWSSDGTPDNTKIISDKSFLTNYQFEYKTKNKNVFFSWLDVTHYGVFAGGLNSPIDTLIKDELCYIKNLR